jgi:Fe-S-cluster containining protein
MTAFSLKQFVPSQVCLKCDGCCRYKEADSAWRPKLGKEDKAGLADRIIGNTDAQGYIAAIQSCGQHFCKFLNEKDNTCGVYNQRPFECSLYPFIISQTPTGIKLYVHLSCPYVQDRFPGAELDSYVAYLKDFFHSGPIKEFLSLNRGMFHDYSSFAPELFYLFDLSLNDDTLLAQKPLVDSFLNQVARPLSAFSSVSIFAWADFFDFEFKVIDDCLCIFAHQDIGCFLYLPPLGRNFTASTVHKAFEHMATHGGPQRVNRIENIPENFLSVVGRDTYNHFLKPAEYVYRKEDLISLKGNAYKSQRHDCNLFTGRFGPCQLEVYEDADFNACMDLFGRWSAERSETDPDGVYQAMLQENRQVHGRLLKCWRPLGLVVRVLRVEGKAAGYTFGFSLDETTFCIYAEIADKKFPGSSAYLFRNFCADSALRPFNRINTMDDFAMPKVARAKQAYHPSEMISSYSISLKDRI